LINIKLKDFNEKGVSDIEYLNTDELEELYAYLTSLREILRSKLDQYLKTQIQKRGITILENTYTGFDSEFEILDVKKNLNKMISAQTAVQRRTIIKIPLYHPYDVSYVNPLSSEISDIFRNKVDNGNSYCYAFREDVSPKPISTDYKDRKKSLNEI
jgi:hypothetical protein